MKEHAKAALARRGLRLQRVPAEERALLDGYDPSHAPSPQAATYLSPANPRLRELEAAYAAVTLPMAAHSQWAAELSTSTADLRFFRGDNAYLWGYTRSPLLNRFRFFAFGRYVASIDELGLLGEVLTEDGGYGCITVDFDTLPTVSRDLLDSVNELSFLARHGVLAATRSVVDIGAGYGRLASRMLRAAPAVTTYYCVDAIPRSTFLAEFYLRDQGVADRAAVVALTDLDAVPRGGVDLAINVHCFSEMTRTAVAGWMQWLAAREVPMLFVVPNERDEILSREVDGSRRDCADLVADAGYVLIASEPTIADPDVRSLLEINDYFLLFRRTER